MYAPQRLEWPGVGIAARSLIFWGIDVPRLRTYYRVKSLAASDDYLRMDFQESNEDTNNLHPCPYGRIPPRSSRQPPYSWSKLHGPTQERRMPRINRLGIKMHPRLLHHHMLDRNRNRLVFLTVQIRHRHMSPCSIATLVNEGGSDGSASQTCTPRLGFRVVEVVVELVPDHLGRGHNVFARLVCVPSVCMAKLQISSVQAHHTRRGTPVV